MHTYIMYHELNKEYYVFNEFLVTIGWKKDDEIDAIILIDGEKVEDQLVWKGLTQTVKKAFVEELDEMKGDFNKKFQESKKANDATKKEISKVSVQIESIIRKGEVSKEDSRR